VRFKASILRDGINADHNAEDYLLETQTVDASSELHLRMASGGGFVVTLMPATR